MSRTHSATGNTIPLISFSRIEFLCELCVIDLIVTSCYADPWKPSTQNAPLGLAGVVQRKTESSTLPGHQILREAKLPGWESEVSFT